MGDMLQPWQSDLIECAFKAQALKTGSFQLKSGRMSPYFFNAGQFNCGLDLLHVGKCFANAIVQSGVDFEVLFGPAYKGIPLVAITALCLQLHHNRNYPYCYNRKEAKDHGEGGSVVGNLAPFPNTRVLIIDDVISAGTAIQESLAIIRNSGSHAVGVCVMVDREEVQTEGDRFTANQTMELNFHLQVISCFKVSHLVTFLQQRNEGDDQDVANQIIEYRSRYGPKTN
eukprot:Platyproteum_vivax@DN2884_c0_g1_i1.p1